MASKLAHPVLIELKICGAVSLQIAAKSRRALAERQFSVVGMPCENNVLNEEYVLINWCCLSILCPRFEYLS
jgi:hypothetical protein